MKRLLLTLALVCLIAGCFFSSHGSGGNVPLPGGDASSKPPVAAIPLDSVRVIIWQGQIGGLDSLGGGNGQAAGLDYYDRLGINLVGVPYGHIGEFIQASGEKRNYIAEIQAIPGVRIFRTYPTLLALAGSELDLGAAIRAWQDPAHPGEFIGSLLDATQIPVTGMGFDIEENLEDSTMRSLTSDDLYLAAEWGKRTSNKREYAEFRSQQITILYRALYASMKARHPECVFAIAYSAGGKDVAKKRHGCDWKLLVDENLAWQNQFLPPIDYAMVGCPSPTIPKNITNWTRKFSVPVFYNIQTYVADPGQETAFYQAKILNLLPLLRPGWGDGLALVDMSAADYRGPQVWDKHDSLVWNLLIRILNR